MVQLTGPHIQAHELTGTATPAAYPYGTRARDDEGNEYIYLKGVALTVTGTWVTYDELGVTTRLVASAKGPVAVAMAAITADLNGWFCIFGKVNAYLTVSTDDNALIGYETTPGSVGDGKATGDEIYGAMSRTDTAALATGAHPCQIWYPWVDAILTRD